MNTFHDLHAALRLLRTRRNLKQQQVAAAAGITRGMLSAYENGKKHPSIETLDKLLDALDAGLADLDEALSAQRGGERFEPTTPRPIPPQPVDEPPASIEPRVDIYQALGIDYPLPVDQEHALRRLVASFLELIRSKHREVQAAFDPAANERANQDR